MFNKILLISVLAALVLSGCGGNLDSPPLVYLVTDSNLVDGFQSSYCWDRIGGTLCVDTIEPYFDESTYLSANAPLRFQFDTPLPDEVTISAMNSSEKPFFLRASLHPNLSIGLRRLDLVNTLSMFMSVGNREMSHIGSASHLNDHGCSSPID